MTLKARQRSVSERMGWYVRRLGSMTPAEVAWRAARVAGATLPSQDLSTLDTNRLLRADVSGWDGALARFRAGVDRPLLLDRDRAHSIAAAHPANATALRDAADRLLEGRVSYFGYPEVQLGRPVDWHLDKVTGLVWPTIASERLDHRTAGADPKWIWEVNRLQHLSLLAQAWLITDRVEYAELAFEHLESWLTQNPVGLGIAWRGAFEVGVRAISVLIALQGFRDCSLLTPERFERIVRMLAAGADYCWQGRSRFSSANNHLVGELAGLAVVGLLLPELRQAAKWRANSLRGLALEAERQILPDGAGAEQAIGYQVFTADLLLVVAVLVASKGETPPARITSALDRSADYLALLVGANDPVPRYGDDDEGIALRLSAEPLRTVRGHLAAVAAFTGNPRAEAAGRSDLFAAWVGGSSPTLPVLETRSAVADRLEQGDSFWARRGGLVVLRSGGRRLTMDIGPLGYLSIAAHGHADALSVTLSVDGCEIIGDPGAASYYGHPLWRQVHRSTLAHPTVTVDDESQSLMTGPFMWRRHARVRTRAVDLRRGIVDAQHDGYRHLRSPVTHRRWLVAPPHEISVLVVDLVEGEGAHDVRVGWPMHPDVTVHRPSREEPQGHWGERGGRSVLQLAYAANAELTADETRGDEESNLGWWTERLESRRPTWWASSHCCAPAPVVIATVLVPHPNERSTVSAVSVQLDGERISVTWEQGGDRRRVVLDRSGDGAVQDYWE